MRLKIKRFCLGILIILTTFPLFAAGRKVFGELQEFLNVETHFVFENNQTGKQISNIYGATGFYIGDGLPVMYKKGEKLVFFVEFVPTVLSKSKSKLKVYTLRPENIDIPVRIEITSKNSDVKLIDTKSIVKVEKDIDEDKSSQIYTFSIKNKEECKRYIKFEITGKNEGSDQIFVTYGNPENKIVDSTCDVFEIIQFTNE